MLFCVGTWDVDRSSGLLIVSPSKSDLFHRSIFFDTLNIRIVLWACLGHGACLLTLKVGMGMPRKNLLCLPVYNTVLK